MKPNVTNNVIDVLKAFDIQLVDDALTLQSQLANTSIINGNQLENDSRKLNAGDVFCATIGHQQDGRKYISSAINKGVSLVLSECEQAKNHGKLTVENNTLIIEFYQLNLKLFSLAKLYYQAPQQHLKIVGITGTNGKTTISQLVAQLYSNIEISKAETVEQACVDNFATTTNCAVIGTTGAGLLGQLIPVINTTPGAIELHQLFYRFVKQGITHVAMEVSSHALVQNRVSASLFDCAIFANLSHDHLDYHHTMENYAAAKFSIFSKDNMQQAIVNGDDSYAKNWLSTFHNCSSLSSNDKTLTVYGRENHDENYAQFVVAKNIKHTAAGLSFSLVTHLGSVDCKTSLIGDFNIDNLLAATAVLLTESISLANIASAITKVNAVAGRMESFSVNSDHFIDGISTPNNHLPTTVVDYAHTPDALKNALQACRQHTAKSLWVVFGCGGERDKAKRPIMGAIAEQYADKVIITNDNPRSEPPMSIAEEVLSGCDTPSKIKLLLDRELAIKYALTHAEASDTVLLAGKGHEQNIVMADEVIPYNEREFVRNIYQTEVVA